MKNFECRLIKELRLLQSDNSLLLTGTPLQNNLKELWSLLNFILPSVFTSASEFTSWYENVMHPAFPWISSDIVTISDEIGLIYNTQSQLRGERTKRPLPKRKGLRSVHFQGTKLWILCKWHATIILITRF